MRKRSSDILASKTLAFLDQWRKKDVSVKVQGHPNRNDEPFTFNIKDTHICFNFLRTKFDQLFSTLLTQAHGAGLLYPYGLIFDVDF